MGEFHVTNELRRILEGYIAAHEEKCERLRAEGMINSPRGRFVRGSLTAYKLVLKDLNNLEIQAMERVTPLPDHPVGE